MTMLGWFLLPRSGVPYYGDVPNGVEVLDGPPAVDPSAIPEPPPKSASKGEWVAYAELRGWAPEDAQRKTKQALIDELGSVEPVEQTVDTGEHEGTVGTEVPGDQLTADGDQLDAGPVEPTMNPEGLDGGLDGHEG